MSGYINPVFGPDFTDYPAPPQNRLASGFNAIWPASNPVGTETTQGMQSATPTDQIAFMRPDGTPVMQSDLARAHEQVQTAMQVAPTMVLGMMGTTDPAGIRAYHGSPYDFERFDTSKIGTGEGAQAYGHGLYFAEGEGTAQSYRDALTSKLKIDNQPVDPTTTAHNLIVSHGGDVDAAINEFSRRVQGWTPGQADRIKADATLAEMESLRGRVSFGPGGGKMYEVNIGADPEQFLHWDRPLSEQPAVAAKMQPLLQDWYEHNAAATGASQADMEKMLTGKLAYETLSHPSTNMSASLPLRQATATEAMANAGIPGIRYLDQGSRGAGQGTHNYVVFDANTIDILRKYGIAGLGIGLSGAAAGTQQQQGQGQ